MIVRAFIIDLIGHLLQVYPDVPVPWVLDPRKLADRSVVTIDRNGSLIRPPKSCGVLIHHLKHVKNDIKISQPSDLLYNLRIRACLSRKS